MRPMETTAAGGPLPRRRRRGPKPLARGIDLRFSASRLAWLPKFLKGRTVARAAAHGHMQSAATARVATAESAARDSLDRQPPRPASARPLHNKQLVHMHVKALAHPAAVHAWTTTTCEIDGMMVVRVRTLTNIDQRVTAKLKGTTSTVHKY